MIITDLITFLIPLIAIIMLLGLLALNAPVKLHIRALTLFLATFGLIISFISLNTLLSYPKPSYFEFVHRNIKEVQIISGFFKPGKAIYLWMKFPNETKPRYYVYDWDKKLAKQLRNAMRKQKNGVRGNVIMKNPFRDGDEINERQQIEFKPIPRQLPPKKYD